jgi:hypothetical protein
LRRKTPICVIDPLPLDCVRILYSGDVGGDVVGVTMAGQSFVEAIPGHTRYAFAEPVGTGILLAPFS